ncbi:PH domain-containing protein [Clostridium thermarum]|uniref:PH domain-containing protein n=1 Tax=Clostridium thermarum TaxID=1716543 RepID=UPI00112109B7|nr:PH domain-containing protein [Clostridium thermarum]
MEWKDRKRFLGLPLSFTRYRLENNRLYVNKGFFSTIEDELVMYRVLDVRLKRTLWDKIFGVGTIILYTADETHKELILEKIKHSKEVRTMISEIAEQERARLGIKGRELYGVADNPDDIDDDNI